MKKKRLIAAGCGAGLAVSAVLMTGGASATTGVNAPTPEPGTLATGVLRGPTKAKKDKIELKVHQDTTVRVFTLKYTPGSNSGWHRHPGIVVAVVESGTVTRRLEDCSTQTFTANQAFTEVTGHLVSNPSTTETAVIRITQFYPTGASPLRQEIGAPNCS